MEKEMNNNSAEEIKEEAAEEANETKEETNETKEETAEKGCINYPLETYEGAYDTYLKLREATKEKNNKKKNDEDDSARRNYEERKKAHSDKRNEKKRIERAEKRAKELETEIARIDTELFGDAAADYLRAADLEAKKAALEEELLACYELFMS